MPDTNTNTLTEVKSKPASNRLRDMAEGRRDLLLFKPEDITILDGFNFRSGFGESPEDKELIQSFLNDPKRAIETMDPLTVFSHEGKVCLSNGHRRLSAIRMANEQGANIECVPCAVRKNYTLLEAKLDQIRLNLGKNPSTLEQSILVQQLIEMGMNQTEIAKALGKTPAHISNCVMIAELPKSVKAKIESNLIASTLVMELARKEQNPEKLEKEVEKVIERARASGKKKATKKHIDKPAAPEGAAPAEGAAEGSAEGAAPADAPKRKEFNRSEVGSLLRLALRGLKDDSDDEAIRDEAAAAVAAFIEENGF